MKCLLLLLISLPCYSNTFRLRDTGSRFDLILSEKRLVYHSHTMDKTIELSPCGAALAESLNNEIIARLPASIPETGALFEVDGKQFRINDKFLGQLLTMDQRIIQFEVEEAKTCK